MEDPAGAILPKGMASGKGRASLPGQAMDLDVVSDGEAEACGGDDDVTHVPAAGKRKGAAGASPTKRAAETPEGITVAMLKTLFADQTAELKTSYRSEMQDAIKACEGRLARAVQETKDDLTAQISDSKNAIAKLETSQALLEARLEKMEQGRGRQMGTVDNRGPALVFGGWRLDTKKSLILSDLHAVLKDAQMDQQLDVNPWVPAVRHSIAIAEFKERQGENTDGVRRRMLAIIAAVNGAKVQSENTQDGKYIWAAISRPKNDRGSGYHCGKVRKLLYQLGIGVADAECAYSTGSLWLKDKLVASVDKTADRDNVKKGKLDRSWLDVALVAKLSGKKQDDVEAAWEEILNN